MVKPHIMRELGLYYANLQIEYPTYDSIWIPIHTIHEVTYVDYITYDLSRPGWKLWGGHTYKLT